MPDPAAASTFRARLAAGERLYGTMVTLTAPAVAEILAGLGFDWLFVDGEHGPFETRDLLAVLQAVGDRAACLFRVPCSDEAPIKRALDLGAAGVIVPQVNTAEQAARVVRYARYAPHGARGVGIARAHGYGLSFGAYVATADAHTTVVVQAEHIDAVRNIEQIVAVPGIDAVLLGPYDLSASLGLMGQINHPDVVAAIDHVTRACLAARIPLGYFGLTPAAVRPYAEKGYTLLVAATDTLMLGEAAKGVLAGLRGDT